jgi:hypothetical protein
VQVNVYEYEGNIVYWVDTIQIDLGILSDLVKSPVSEGSMSLEIFPNPFQGSTNINIDLDTQQKIILRLLNQAGSEIEVIANETLARGSYEFVFENQSLPAGIYYVQLVAGDTTQIRKMIKFE